MKKFVKTLLLICWLCLIYYFSSQTGTESGGLSNRILASIGSFLKVSDIDSFVSTFGFLIRKTAHFSEYFILFILSYECFKEYKLPKLLLISIIFCVLVAGFDEFHQLFVTGRSGQFTDVLIDSSGSLISSLVWHKLFKR